MQTVKKVLLGEERESKDTESTDKVLLTPSTLARMEYTDYWEGSSSLSIRKEADRRSQQTTKILLPTQLWHEKN